MFDVKVVSSALSVSCYHWTPTAYALLSLLLFSFFIFFFFYFVLIPQWNFFWYFLLSKKTRWIFRLNVRYNLNSTSLRYLLTEWCALYNSTVSGVS